MGRFKTFATIGQYRVDKHQWKVYMVNRVYRHYRYTIADTSRDEVEKAAKMREFLHTLDRVELLI